MNNVVKFLLDNWTNILTIIVLIITGVLWIKKTATLMKGMSDEEKIAYVKRLIQNLIPSALVLVTDAEINFGGGTGPLKKSYVYDELYSRIPDEFKKYVTEENIVAIIEAALIEAKKLWNQTPRIIPPEDEGIPEIGE